MGFETVGDPYITCLKSDNEKFTVGTCLCHQCGNINIIINSKYLDAMTSVIFGTVLASIASVEAFICSSNVVYN